MIAHHWSCLYLPVLITRELIGRSQNETNSNSQTRVMFVWQAAITAGEYTDLIEAVSCSQLAGCRKQTTTGILPESLTFKTD